MRLYESQKYVVTLLLLLLPQCDDCSRSQCRFLAISLL